MADLYIDGTWRGAADGATRDIICPADGRWVRSVSEAGSVDTSEAIAAARRAFDHGPWPRSSAEERGILLRRVAQVLERDKDRYARAESLDTGKRLVESELDLDDIIAVFRHYAELATVDPDHPVDTGRADITSRVVHEPIGVCGLITPWNYPLLQTAWKVAPCLAAGNTLVLKPSELSPSTAILLMHSLHEAGLPPGAANLILGAGHQAGQPLADHPEVDLLSFTGGLHTGRHLMASAAGTVKKVALELGGKNPNIVFADADLEVALDFALTAGFLHSGQVCSAGARLLLEESIAEEFTTQLVDRAHRIRLGGPFDPDAETGPLISATHREKVEAFVATGLAEGAELLCGGQRPNGPTLADGFFYLPTILGNCQPGMSVVREEAFGPVITVETFTGDSPADTETAAIDRANDTPYGLAGAVWTQDQGRGERVAARLRLGTVWINDYHPYVPQAEWGGFKQSGVGRELGAAGLDEYREIKHIWTNRTPRVEHWFGG